MGPARLDVALHLDEVTPALVVEEGRAIHGDGTGEGAGAGVKTRRGQVSGQEAGHDDGVPEDGRQLAGQEGCALSQLVQGQDVGVCQELLVEDLRANDDCQLRSYRAGR